MTPDDLYKIYAKWTGEIHFWSAKYLGAQLNAEFFPEPAWEMEVFPGDLYQDAIATVPHFIHRPGIRIKLPRPEHSPTEEELQEAFRRLCLAAARVLGVDTGTVALPEKTAPESAIVKNAPKRTQPKNRKSDGQKRSRVLRSGRHRRSA